jgi:hypothetical protein
VARDVAGTALKGLLDNRPGTTRPNGTAAPATDTPAGTVADTPAADTPAPEPAPAPEPTPVSTPEPEAPIAAVDLTVPDVDELAIPDYDELSASQVVERLEGLDAGELEAVRRYEAAHRGRNTILGKIAQLG